MTYQPYKLRLNPRFDGAFLNSNTWKSATRLECLNPRFDGAFLNCIEVYNSNDGNSLNPRFDGAFLNCNPA